MLLRLLPVLLLPPNEECVDCWLLRLLGMNELAGVWFSRLLFRVEKPDDEPKFLTVVRVELSRALELLRVAGTWVLLERAPPKLLLFERDVFGVVRPTWLSLLRVPKLPFVVEGVLLERVPPKLLFTRLVPCWRLLRAKSNPLL